VWKFLNRPLPGGAERELYIFFAHCAGLWLVMATWVMWRGRDYWGIALQDGIPIAIIAWAYLSQRESFQRRMRTIRNPFRLLGFGRRRQGLNDKLGRNDGLGSPVPRTPVDPLAGAAARRWEE